MRSAGSTVAPARDSAPSFCRKATRSDKVPAELSGIRPARIISTCLGMPSTGSKTKAVNVVNFQTLGKFVVMEQEFFVGGL